VALVWSDVPNSDQRLSLSDVPYSDKFIFLYFILRNSFCSGQVTLRALEILGGRSARMWPPFVRHQLFFEFEPLCVVCLHLAREQMQQRQ